MPSAPVTHLKIGRVLHEDDDFITLEVGKRDDVSFHLQQDENGDTVGGDTVGGDKFLTLVFVRQAGNHAQTWEPWA